MDVKLSAKKILTLTPISNPIATGLKIRMKVRIKIRRFAALISF